ncbi:WRKY transcription factor 55 [Abrus precatorius]|uniref:WRKY transcription factor 55 n=1 Tax=Abrus precatorius TaxID=3816 RepID=A0A8B8JQH4_ABRPR|nr:WRKY transcription factor 55 [Abrus precatorius]
MASQTEQKISETMEEVVNSTKHACELARNLEPEIPNMANQPNMLLLSIDEAMKAFGAAKERLLTMMSQEGLIIAPSSFASMLPRDETPQGQIGASSVTSMQELMSSGSYAHNMDQLLLMQQPFDVRALLENRGTLQIGEMGRKDLEGSDRSKGSEGEMQGIEASPSRSRKGNRKNDLKKRTILLPAPQVGNIDMPPEDGFTWRKYGQKEILGTKFPRAYYRCTHQKLYACPAKKQVQRLDDNPNIFEVTYRGDHTCHMSSTAPSSFPPPQLLVDMSKDITQTQSTISPELSPSSKVSGWLSPVNLSLHSGSGGGGAGPSTSKYGTDYFVADMADAMFNSGSSSGNSMECLFPSTDDKWEAGEKKS